MSSTKAGGDLIALNTSISYLLIYVIFSNMNCKENDHLLMLFTSVLITIFLFLFPLLHSARGNVEGKAFTPPACLCLPPPRNYLHILQLSSFSFIHIHREFYFKVINPSSVTNHKHSKKLHHHFEGCLPVREVNAFAPFQWQRLSLLGHGRKGKLTSCSQFYVEFFFPDRGGDLARRIQVHVKSYLT